MLPDNLKEEGGVFTFRVKEDLDLVSLDEDRGGDFADSNVLQYHEAASKV